MREALLESLLSEVDTPEDYEKTGNSSRDEFKSDKKKLELYDSEFNRNIALGLQPQQADFFAKSAVDEFSGLQIDAMRSILSKTASPEGTTVSRIPPMYPNQKTAPRTWLSTNIQGGMDVFDESGKKIGRLMPGQQTRPSDVEFKSLYNDAYELIAIPNAESNTWITATTPEDETLGKRPGSSPPVAAVNDPGSAKREIDVEETISKRFALIDRPAHPQFVVYAKLKSGSLLCKKLNGNSPDTLSFSDLISELGAKPVPGFKAGELLNYIKKRGPESDIRVKRGFPAGAISAAGTSQEKMTDFFIVPSSSVTKFQDPVGHSTIEALIEAKSGQECVYTGPSSALFDYRVYGETSDKALKDYILHRAAICSTYQPVWFAFVQTALQVAIEGALTAAMATWGTAAGATATSPSGPGAAVGAAGGGTVGAAAGYFTGKLVTSLAVNVITEAIPYVFAYSYFSGKGKDADAFNSVLNGALSIFMVLSMPFATSKLGTSMQGLKAAQATSKRAVVQWMINNSDNLAGKFALNVLMLICAAIISVAVTLGFSAASSNSDFRLSELEQFKKAVEEYDDEFEKDVELRAKISGDKTPDLGLTYQFDDHFALS